MPKRLSGPYVSGRLTNKQQGSAIGGATITVSQTVYTDDEMQNATTTVVTDGTGGFSFYALPGVYTFTTSVADAAPIEPIEILGSEGLGADRSGTAVAAGRGRNALTGWFHANGYGVAADGTTDDTANLQAVISAAGTAGGGTVVLPAGTLRTTDTVYVPSNVTVRGAHHSETTIKRGNNVVTTGTVVSSTARTAVLVSGSAQYTPYSNASRGKNIAIEDLTVDGNKANNSVTLTTAPTNIFAHNIAATFVDGFHVRRCVTKNSVQNGVYSYGCTDVRVTDNEFSNCGIDVGATFARECFSFNGSSSREANGCIVIGNYFHDAVGTCVAFGAGNNLHVGGNYMSDAQKGVEGDTSYTGVGLAECVITDNIIRNLASGPAGTQVGISIACSDNIKAVISGNKVTNVLAAGITFTQANNSTALISGNLVEGFGGGYAAGASTQYHGVSVSGHRVTVTDNSIRDGSAIGISVIAGTHILINDNMVENVKSDGIATFLSTTTVNNLSISGNSIYQADNRGIRIQTAGTVSKLVLNGNILGAVSVSGAGKPGIVIDGASTAIKRLVMNGNVVVDERGTPFMTYGLDLSGLTTAILSAAVTGNVFYPAVTGGWNGKSKVTLLADSNNIIDAGGPATASSGTFLRSGLYYFATPGTGTTTSAVANGNLRVAPMVVPRQVTITNVGADITAAGDSGSTLRIGIYNDDGTGYPGPLVADCGTVPADAIAQPEITGLSVTLNPGTYWVGAAVQGAPSTLPTVRCLANVMVSVGTNTKPGAGAGLVGYVATGVTGALSNFTPTVTSSGNVPRIFVKIA